ncbi:hypothetical protein VNO77_12774 [Canavalia gladiata]|uniref:Uncharacterized protein n=1 Tax=Canavalia gladiata TaxID=3824 RepID=A0AAN9QUK8_CANGL
MHAIAHIEEWGHVTIMRRVGHYPILLLNNWNQKKNIQNRFFPLLIHRSIQFLAEFFILVATRDSRPWMPLIVAVDPRAGDLPC